MNSLVRFSDHDIFGYLASGLAFLIVVDAAFGTQLVIHSGGWTVSQGVLVIGASYVLGHIIAALASLLIERLLVDGVLGIVDNRLMTRTEEVPDTGWRSWFLGGYLMPLPQSVWKRVDEQAGLSVAEAQSNPTLGEEIFWQAWTHIKTQPIPYARIESFLRLYEFCRQITFVTIIAALAFAYSILTGHPPETLGARPNGWWVAAAVACAFVMFDRYLKFLRAYSLEVFITFADRPSAAAGVT